MLSTSVLPLATSPPAKEENASSRSIMDAAWEARGPPSAGPVSVRGIYEARVGPDGGWWYYSKLKQSHQKVWVYESRFDLSQHGEKLMRTRSKWGATPHMNAAWAARHTTPGSPGAGFIGIHKVHSARKEPTRLISCITF